jgi:penicillin-binding protein 1C
VIAFILAWVLLPFPTERLEKWSVSPTVLDVNNRPLLSIVGSDDQWRCPVRLNEMSDWLKLATIAVEDERFYSHFGVDPLAILRAAGQNFAAMRTVSGASTLNMQVCRMLADHPRSLKTKIIESFRALQLNQLLGKDAILELYLNIAPYGGNIRGVEAASLSYFGRHAKDLNLGQAALLAGLPQSPSRYRPDRHLPEALQRQHIVLTRMLKAGMITENQLKQALSNPVELDEQQLAKEAYHAAWYALKCRPSGGRTTINLDIQKQVEHLAQEHLNRLPKDSEISVVVIDIADSSVVSLIGSGNTFDEQDGQVNGALAKRSPGSALKPFIYAAAFEAGRLNGDSIVYDIPISRAGWTPSNFDKSFAGQITAKEALQRSLNIPAILIAEETGLARCYGIIDAAGITLPTNAQRRGGLSLAVGGIEVSLLELTNGYATIGRDGIKRPLRIYPDEPAPEKSAISPNVCRAISSILSCRLRCPAGLETVAPENIPWFMWKTGTSSGRRDAWAVGHNRRYAIGVWVGRFRGTGRVDYVGGQAAEPLLAELFCLPCLKASAESPPAELVKVYNPMPVPGEVAKTLNITSPSFGDTFICYNGSAVIRTSANRNNEISWFLNGKLLDDDMASRLTLPAGKYELLCTDNSGQSSRVDFTVLNTETADLQSSNN